MPPGVAVGPPMLVEACMVARSGTRHAAPGCATLTGVAAAMSRRGETATTAYTRQTEKVEKYVNIDWWRGGTIFYSVLRARH